jgi:hypothetical protein
MATVEQKYEVLKRYTSSIVDVIIDAVNSPEEFFAVSEKAAQGTIEHGVDRAVFDEVLNELIADAETEIATEQSANENAAKQGYPNA